MLPPDYQAEPPVRSGFVRAYVGPVAVKIAIGFLTLMGMYGLATILVPPLAIKLPYGEAVAWLLLWIATIVVPLLAFRPLYEKIHKLELENYYKGLAVEGGAPLVTDGLKVGQHRSDSADKKRSRVEIYGSEGAEPVFAREIEIVVSRPLAIFAGIHAQLSDHARPTMGEHTQDVSVERQELEQTYRLVFDEEVRFAGREIFLRLQLIGATDWSEVRRVIVIR